MEEWKNGTYETTLLANFLRFHLFPVLGNGQWNMALLVTLWHELQRKTNTIAPNLVNSYSFFSLPVRADFAKSWINSGGREITKLDNLVVVVFHTKSFHSFRWGWRTFLLLYHQKKQRIHTFSNLSFRWIESRILASGSSNTRTSGAFRTLAGGICDYEYDKQTDIK